MVVWDPLLLTLAVIVFRTTHNHRQQVQCKVAQLRSSGFVLMTGPDAVGWNWIGCSLCPG